LGAWLARTAALPGQQSLSGGVGLLMIGLDRLLFRLETHPSQWWRWVLRSLIVVLTVVLIWHTASAHLPRPLGPMVDPDAPMIDPHFDEFGPAF
jgi:hypothetical protein